jgi:outer membrane biosynthesis protein TonB
MPIEVICDSCGKRYYAPDQMAGKRIKCRNCSATFLVPDISAQGENPDDPLSQLAALQEGFGHDSTMAEGNPVELPPPEDEPMAVTTSRYRPRFVYPYSNVVDRWLPILLLIGGPLWIAYATFGSDENATPGLSTARFIVLMITYLILVFPMGLGGVKMAARDLGFSLPRTSTWRALATFMPTFTLAAVIWMVSGGHIAGLVLGLFAGFLVSAATLWLLFHLQPSELPAAAGYAGGMTALAIAIAAGLLIALNALTGAVMTGLKKADSLSGSPYGMAFTWPNSPKTEPPPVILKKTPPSEKTPQENAPQQTPAPAATQQTETEVASVPANNPAVPAPEANTAKQFAPANPSPNSQSPNATSGPGKPLFQDAVDQDASNSGPSPASQPSLTIPPDLMIPSPLVESASLAPLDDCDDRLIRPLTPSPWAILQHYTPQETQLNRIWVGGGAPPEEVKPWKSSGMIARARAGDDQVPEQYAISPNGDLLAYVSTFPTFSVVVKSFSQRRIVQTLKLSDPTSLQADVLGFASDDRLLVHRNKSGHHSIEQWDVKTGAKQRPIDMYEYDVNSPPILSPDGSTMALAVHDRTKPSELTMTILLFELPSGIGHKIVTSDLNATESTIASGLAFSPDGTKLAALFEQGANGLLALYNLSSSGGKQVLSQPLMPIPSKPQLPFNGSSILWLTNDALLVYGRSVLTTTGAEVGDLGILSVSGQAFEKPDTCDLRIQSQSLRGVAVVKVKIDQIPKPVVGK